MPKHDLSLDPSIMNAAGTLGFSPDLHCEIDWHHFGAFVTNPISLLPRTPANGQRFASFLGGFLLHTGYHNPGLERALRLYARHWSHSPIPVMVHLLATNASESAQMARRMEGIEGVIGLEIGLSGEASVEQAAALIQAAAGELPVVARLPMERSTELAPGAIKAGAIAVSLAPPRGAFQAVTGELVQGRLYGPSVFPLALRTVQELSQQGIPVIGGGGVYTQEQCETMRKAGALAVQLDSVLWLRTGNKLFA